MSLQFCIQLISYLIVRSSKSTPNIFIIQDLHFEGEVLLHVLDDHDQVRQLYSQGLLSIRWAGDVCCAHIRPNNFKNK